MRTHFILYVADQKTSTEFYEKVLLIKPSLYVQGMTEFEIGTDTIIGLMPEAAAERLLNIEYTAPPLSRSPRCEIYLVVSNAAGYYARALEAGAREASPMLERDWGHTAGYCFDPDGHVLAFATLTAV